MFDIWGLFLWSRQTASGQHADAGISKTAKEGGYSAVKEKRKVHVSGVKIFYGSQTGTAKVGGLFTSLAGDMLC